jgi:hypothetical protein
MADHVFTACDWISRADQDGRDGGDPTADDGWGRVACAVDASPGDLVRARQVHGTVVSAGRPPAARRPEADVLIARDETLAVAVQVADCVPVLLADPRTGAVAAVHAGWRGLAARAPVVAVHALTAEYGTRPYDVIAAFGPSIGACCYEVGPDVKAQFAASGVAARTLERWFLERPAVVPGNPPMPGVRLEGREGRWYFDGWSAVRDQLEEAGVEPARIFGPNLCTGSHPGVFCSFRRDGAGAGRMAAAIHSRRDRAPSGVRLPRP